MLAIFASASCYMPIISRISNRLGISERLLRIECLVIKPLIVLMRTGQLLLISITLIVAKDSFDGEDVIGVWVLQLIAFLPSEEFAFARHQACCLVVATKQVHLLRIGATRRNAWLFVSHTALKPIFRRSL